MESQPDAQTSINPSDNDAFAKGYDDYQKFAKEPPTSVFESNYNPVKGNEKAYDEGWKQAEKEAKEREFAFLLSLQ